MSSDLLEIARKVAGAAKDGEQVEAYVMRAQEADVEVFGGEVESLTTAGVEGVGVRVIVNHRQGLAWAGSLDADVVEDTLREARDNAAFGEPDEWYGVASPTEANGAAPPALDLWREELTKVPTEEKVRIALELERATKAADARIRNVEAASYGDALSEGALVNSLGVEAHTRRTICSASSVALADDGSGTQTGYGFAAGRTLADLDLDAIPRDAAMRATRLLGAKPAPGRRIPVILDPLVTRSVLGVLSSAFNGESMLKGRSLFMDRVGQQVGASHVQLVDDPTDGRALGVAQYDGDGVPTRRNALIVDGVLQRFLHNVYTGRRSGSGTTASATRSFASTPGVGVRALTARAGSEVAGRDHARRGRGLLRAVGERVAFGHEPDQRRLLRWCRGADDPRRRVCRTCARGDGGIDVATHAARHRRRRRRPHVPARLGRRHDGARR